MDMNLEHGISYKVIDNSDEFIELSPIIRMMLKSYKEKAAENYEVDEIMNLMSYAVNHATMFVIAFLKEGAGIGLMTAHAVNHNDSEQGAMIHVGYVSSQIPKNESVLIIDTAMNELKKWAENLKMYNIFARTNRNEKPFDKLLMKSGWQRITTVYKMEIKHERR